MLKKLWNNPYTTIIKIFALINIILVEVNIGLWIRAAQEHLFKYADFTSLYNTFVDNRIGTVGKLIGIDGVSIYHRGILGALSLENGVYPLQYPPVISLVFTPLSYLPFNIAYSIWMFVELGLLVWLIYQLSQLFKDWNQNERFLFIITLLAFFPLAFTILTGQFSLFILICLVQLYIAMKNDKNIRAGIWLSFLIIKPQTILIPALLSISKRYWRVGVTAIISAMTLVFLSSLLYGLETWENYIRSLLSMGINYEKNLFQPEAEYTFRGLLTRIFGSSHSSTISILTSVALLMGMIFVFFLWFRSSSPDTTRFKLRFAFIIVLSVFLSLHLYDYDNLILVLPAAIFYDYLREMGFPTKCYSILLLFSPLIFFIGMFNSFNLFGFIRPPLAVTLIILAWMIKYLILDFREDRMKRQINMSYTDHA